LYRKADALVFLNKVSQDKILPVWNNKIVAIIPEGPIRISSSITRSEMRRRLEVSDSKVLLVLVGRLESYKGIDFLFSAATVMPKNFAIRIAGFCSGRYLQELNLLASEANLKGLDIRLEPGVLSNEDFASYLKCADYFIYPCREVNNSGSINAALSANLPVIVPDRLELAWIDPSCKLEVREISKFEFDFEECFTKINTMPNSSYQSLIIGTQEWVAERSWEKVSKGYFDLYREVLH
jgi:glycosyltransferase involved in cell wall biosynthesis